MLTRISINTSDKYLAINLCSCIPLFLLQPILLIWQLQHDLPLLQGWLSHYFFKILVSVVLEKGSGALQFPALNASGHFQDCFS